MTTPDRLDAAFAALAHPTRRAILARLSEGEASVNDLAAPFDMTLPAISRHLKVLEEGGLITRGRSGQSRPCALNPEGLQAVAGWADAYRHIWNARFDAMADLLHQTKGTAHDR